ncbi:MAG: Uma2 family endonuclease [Planctomycetota bacterium]|nr:Uma2 family endonuclease [Planctomycetota bacterium]
MSILLRDPAADAVAPQFLSASVGDPTWDVAYLFPRQGEWTEEDYLSLDANRLIELANGRLEVLPMPTLAHQLLLDFVYFAIRTHVREVRAGIVVAAPLPVHLYPGTYREPDLVFLRSDRVIDPDAPVQGADLVVEIVSDGEENRHRDLVVKRAEYAKAGIGEYWIVDRKEVCVHVLVLQAGEYRLHATFRSGDVATSVVLPGLRISVTDLFASARKSVEGTNDG